MSNMTTNPYLFVIAFMMATVVILVSILTIVTAFATCRNRTVPSTESRYFVLLSPTAAESAAREAIHI